MVLASDGAVTGTITQQTKKLSIIDDCIVIGSSGPVGLSQRLAGTLGYYCKNVDYSKVDAFLLMTELARRFREHIQMESAIAQNLQNLAPWANSIWQSFTLVALPLQGSARLFSFDMSCAPTESTDSLPYFSIGSGNYLV